MPFSWLGNWCNWAYNLILHSMKLFILVENYELMIVIVIVILIQFNVLFVYIMNYSSTPSLLVPSLGCLVVHVWSHHAKFLVPGVYSAYVLAVPLKLRKNHVSRWKLNIKQEQGLYVLSCEFVCVTCCTKMFILSADIPRLSGLRGWTRSLSQFNCQMQKMLRLILGLMEILHSLLVLVQRTILMKWNWTFLTKLMLRKAK